MKSNKKGINEIGGAIIVMGILLLLGSFFFDSSFDSTKKKYLDEKINEGIYPEETYLFYLNETDIGKQKKVTESFPNIELGSVEENKIVYIGNNFRLYANLFTKNMHTFQVNFPEPENVNAFLIYFNPDRIVGNNEIIIRANGREVVRSQVRSSDLPIRVPITSQTFQNSTNVKIEMEIVKPSFWKLWDWNKIDILDLKVVEIKQNKDNNIREFNFQVDKEFLDRAYIDLAIECPKNEEISNSIKITVNGYIISNENPNCLSRYNTITAPIPYNIINEDKNELILETNGYYKVAYSVNKIFYNDKQTYKFTVNNFDDIIDVVIYGDFDKEVIDIRLNGVTMALGRDEIKSIMSDLRFGTNELKILTKPVEIEELIIEKNEVWR